MNNEQLEKRIHEGFEVSILLKGAGALLETTLGILLLFTNVLGVVQALISYALVQDPDNFFATHAQDLTSVSLSTQHFGALYLLSHGLVKLVLVAGLLRDKLWAYPASLAILSLFVLNQVVRYAQTYSVWLLLLTMFDLVVIWLVRHEYRIKKRTLGMVQ